MRKEVSVLYGIGKPQKTISRKTPGTESPNHMPQLDSNQGPLEVEGK